MPLPGGLREEEVAGLAAVEHSASQPYWEGERNNYHVCSQSLGQSAVGGHVQELVLFPPGMVEINGKVHYLFKSYESI